MNFVRATFSTRPFIYELLPGVSLEEALLVYLECSDWIELQGSFVEPLLEIAKCIDASAYSITDPADEGLDFVSGDFGHPTLFSAESEFLPINIHLTSTSLINGYPCDDDRPLLAIRVGREYRQLYADRERSIKFYRAICNGFDPSIFNSMYGGDSTRIYNYFYARRRGLLSAVNNSCITKILPEVGIMAKSLFVDNYKDVLDNADLIACWEVGCEHIFMDTWGHLRRTDPDRFKKIAVDLGLKYTFYDVPIHNS